MNMKKSEKKKIHFEISCGNVFEDLGHEDADLKLEAALEHPNDYEAYKEAFKKKREIRRNEKSQTEAKLSI